jgi:hypothetical protein
VKFSYRVEVEVERIEGKFASREDLGGQIQEALECADLGSLTGENDGQYETTSWEVSEHSP